MVSAHERRQVQQFVSDGPGREGVEDESAVVRFYFGGADCANCLEYIVLVMDRLPDVGLTSMDYASATATASGTFGKRNPTRRLQIDI